MLEEGEIDEEIDPQPAIQPEQPKAQQPASKSPTNNEPETKQSLLPTPKPQQQQHHQHHHHHHHSKPAPMPLLKTDSSKIPSLLSTNFENPKLKKRKNANHNESNGNNSELLNKRKKVFNKNSNFDDEIDDEEDELNEEPDENNGDKDERLQNNNDKYFKPIKNGNGLLKTPLLATPSATPSSSSSWSAPKSSNTAVTAAVKTGPISLFDLFKNTGDNLAQSADNGATSFVDPIITEKENNKPNKFSKNMNENNNNEEEYDESEMVSTDSIKEKMEKKRKYIEIAKDKQKKEQEKLDKQKEKAQNLKEKVLCHFFVEGRCQKGDKCTFSHNIQLNKKYEICKFYLNGFCSKNDKCLFMHSDFPCKFYHRVNFATGQKKNQCLNGDKCRFSHEPITNPLLKEAFDKYLLESNTNESSGNNSNGPQPLLNSNGSGIKRPSLLGSPPPPSKDDLPSLMDLPIKPAILPTPTLRTEIKTSSPPSSPPLPASNNQIKTNNIPFRSSFQDVDERHQTVAPTSAGDIDERSAANLSPAPAINYETVKAELITRIMKALADNDGGIFSQIPRQTLIELLVKLLNPSETGLSTEAIITLLATLTAASTLPIAKDLARQNTNSSIDEDKSGLNESSSNLQIDLSGSGGAGKKKRRISELNGSDYDSIDEDDDYGYENDLVIEGNAGDIPYRLVEIDIEPSGLWTCPPVAFVNPNTDLNGDQECDPRIKYYSNKSNCNNVANFQLLLQQQQQQQEKQQQQQTTPTSPSSNTQQQSTKQQTDPIQSILGANSTAPATYSPLNTAETGAKAAKTSRVDPRLARNANSNNNNVNNQSPTRSVSPSLQDSNNVLTNLITPLLNSANKGLSQQASSLLSSLADGLGQEQAGAAQKTQNSLSETQTVRLSIEDYKRKKPTSLVPNSSMGGLAQTNANLTTQQILNSLIPAGSASGGASASLGAVDSSSNNSNNSTSSLPSIPSYSLNLQAPQSLHELFRNFQS